MYGSIKNFDDCNNNGYYNITGASNDSILNNPGIDYGILFFYQGNESNGYSIQFAFDMFGNKPFAYRMTNSASAWLSWRVLG